MKSNLNSKRFFVTILALVVFTMLVLLGSDLILCGSAIGIIISPFITSETFKKKE